MWDLPRLPLVVFLVSMALLWTASFIGGALQRYVHPLPESAREEFKVVMTAALTLLGLIIGFSFSMAISRYDQRKNLEEEEANAIGTEYLRADLLPADASQVKSLLRAYLEQRVAFYTASDRQPQASTRTTELQNLLWSTVRTAALAQPSPVAALAAAGMNDVINSEGYSEAAWRNRIPVAAWILMMAIAALSNALVGYGARHGKPRGPLTILLPLLYATAMLLIADIDTPRGGVIRVVPQNLTRLLESLPPA